MAGVVIMNQAQSLVESLNAALAAQSTEISLFLSRIVSHGKGILKPNQILADFEGKCKGCKCDDAFKRILKLAQEAIVFPPLVAFTIRISPGVWEYVLITATNELNFQLITVQEYLLLKEDLVDGDDCNGNSILELDFESFATSIPKPTLTKSIGNGMEFLNRHISATMFHDKESMAPLLDFLRAHHYKGKTMMLNERITNLNALQAALHKAVECLAILPPETPYSEFESKFDWKVLDWKVLASLKVFDCNHKQRSC